MTTGARLVDRTPWGVGWLSPRPRFMRRASHAVLADGGVWFLDPVLDEAGMEAAAALGPPAGVVQLLDRHARDCDAVARRLGVPLLVVPERAPEGAPFEVIEVLRSSRLRWSEVALWFPEHRALAVADALGTPPYFRAAGERIGPHPLMRLLHPPRTLAGRQPWHVLCGHGAGLHGPDAAGDVDDAIAHSRRRLLPWLGGLVRINRPD